MRTTLFLIVGLLASGCLGGGGNNCVPTLALVPSPDDTGVVAVSENRAAAITAAVDLCQSDQDYSINWFYDENGDGLLQPAETDQPRARTATWRFFNCFADRGDHLVRVTAAPLDPSADPVSNPVLQHEFTLRVQASESAPQRPACFAAAADAVRNANDIQTTVDVQPFKDAVECVDPYLEENLCDFEANMISGLSHFTIFSGQIPERWLTRSELTVDDVLDIFHNEVEPVLDRYQLIEQKAPEDFSFRVDGKFQLRVFEDLPFLSGSEDIDIVLQGEHDMGDIRGVAALAALARGFFQLMLAYEGLPQFILDTPRLDRLTPEGRIEQLISSLEGDPEFFTIGELDGVAGRSRLLESRAQLIDGIGAAQEALRFVASETDNQNDDLFRYWDCGADGLCDCSDTTNIVFLVCPNDEGSEYPGPDDDGTEGNNRYDPGEPVGVDRVNFNGFFALDLPSNIDEFIRQIGIIQTNLIGPDKLDLDELAGAPVEQGMSALNIPVPEIRLSQWFLSPSQPRDLIPLYSISARTFVFDSEGELYVDDGYDGKPNEQEVVVHDNNPLGLPLGTGYDKLTNPDPHFDDLNPICSGVCNFTDGIDNDADGVTDANDRAIINQFGFTVVVPQEIGVENNLMFDYVDLNRNRVHDPGEPSEPFEDVGVPTHKGVLAGADNDAWDFADRQHEYPTGDDIGPFRDIIQTDPANGIAADANDRAFALGLFGDTSTIDPRALQYQGLFDPFYFFFPEPTLSGALTFPEDIQSIDGDFLTNNAKLQRFINKILELANLVQVAERTGDGIEISPVNLTGHQCADEDACLAAVDKLK